MLQTLRLSEDKRRRLKFPAGLDIGATTAEEIALSILAEMVQMRRSRAPAAARGAERSRRIPSAE